MSRLHCFDVVRINQSKVLKLKKNHVLRWCVQTFDWWHVQMLIFGVC